MKRKILNIIGLLLIVLCVTACGTNSKLSKIAKYFNESDTVKSYKEYGYELKATAKKDTLTITSKMDDNTTTTVFTLKDNILQNTKLQDEEILTTLLVIDSIGQLQGYEKGKLSQSFNAFPDKVKEYTLENEGIELVFDENKKSLKIDLTKKVPLIDMNEYYIQPEIFDYIEEIKKNNEPGNQNGRSGNIAYDISLDKDINTIEIGQEEELSTSAYKSILSALEVMYSKEVANHFKEIYPEFVNGKKTIEAFTIDTNYKRDDQENSVFKDTKEVFITIDNSKIK